MLGTPLGNAHDVNSNVKGSTLTRVFSHESTTAMHAFWTSMPEGGTHRSVSRYSPRPLVQSHFNHLQLCRMIAQRHTAPYYHVIRQEADGAQCFVLEERNEEIANPKAFNLSLVEGMAKSWAQHLQLKAYQRIARRTSSCCIILHKASL